MIFRWTQAQKNKKYFSAPVSGFTLVEIIVVLAILSVIVSITVQGFAQYSYRQVYVAFVSEVRDNIVESRQRTIASYNDTVYGVYVGASTIEFFSGDVPVVGAVSNTIINIPAHLTATSSFSNANWYVSFKRLTGEASAAGTIVFTDTRTNASTTLTIYSSGLVE